MSDSATDADRHSFVIRIWCDTGDSQAAAWRGSVDHVGSGHRLYFDEPEAIVRFVREQIGLRTQPRRWWAAVLGWIRREHT